MPSVFFLCEGHGKEGTSLFCLFEESPLAALQQPTGDHAISNPGTGVEKPLRALGDRSLALLRPEDMRASWKCWYQNENETHQFQFMILFQHTFRLIRLMVRLSSARFWGSLLGSGGSSQMEPSKW